MILTTAPNEWFPREGKLPVTDVKSESFHHKIASCAPWQPNPEWWPHISSNPEPLGGNTLYKHLQKHERPEATYRVMLYVLAL